MISVRTRPPITITLDPAVVTATRELAQEIGVPIPRVIDAALRRELAAHGREVLPSTPRDEAAQIAVAARRRTLTEGA